MEIQKHKKRLKYKYLIGKENVMSSANEEKYLELKPGQLEKAKELAEKIGEILDSKKAGNVKIIETNKQTIIADYFVIATGTSSTHIRSLSQEIEFQMKEQSGIPPSRISGQESRDWIIIDYDSVLVHIFNNEAREYYKLEKLWDGGSIDVDKIIELQPEIAE
jgi:ribosome-associated protein